MQAIPSSYKDPSGFIFLHQDQYYRQVNPVYQKHYDHLMTSGLHETLVQQEKLIPHQDVTPQFSETIAYKIILPQQISVISYAWEWSFGMLRDAALCTLDNARAALSHSMILKDANTYNIQFIQGKPMLIDTLSFEIYEEGKSWIAYHQFCEQFLAPLALMKYTDVSLNKLLQIYPEGIPLSVCRKLLPSKAKFNLHIYLHIFLQSQYAGKQEQKKQQKQFFSKAKLLTLLNGLYDFVSGLSLVEKKSTWNNYYDETILSQHYLDEKKKLVLDLVNTISIKSLLDLGANDGAFSLLLSNQVQQTISIDGDAFCIDRLYEKNKAEKRNHILALCADLTAMSPAIGWDNRERPALLTRLKADLCMALALIHHLAIGRNVPIEKCLELFASFGTYVLVEFVDKTDPKVQILLQDREDIFPDYTLDHFRQLASNTFDILAEKTLQQNTRTLFLLKLKNR
ncbi:MAG: hypothetical protein JNJ58_12530 [Chitinophagaceae bacterium]|nr:hypothetical protein [Chitinophagaceae bacterium]